MPGSRKSHFQCQRDLRDFAKGETHFRVCGCAPSGAFDSYSEEACSLHLAQDLRGGRQFQMHPIQYADVLVCE